MSEDTKTSTPRSQMVGTKPIALISEGSLRHLLQDTGGTFRISAPKWPTKTETVPLYLAPPPSTDHVVGIKPLDWKEYNFHTRTAKTICGYYEVQYRAFGDGVTRWYWKRSGDPLTTSFDTEDEAKAAAQAHFDARIRSALASAEVEG